MDRLFSLKDAAKHLGCSEAMLRKWIYQGKLPTVKVGRLTRIRQIDLEAWGAARIGGWPNERPVEEGRCSRLTRRRFRGSDPGVYSVWAYP